MSKERGDYGLPFFMFSKDLKEQQLVHSLGRTVLFDDEDTNVHLIGKSIGFRINNSYHPNEPEILIDLDGYTFWASVWEKRITVKFEE